MPFNYMHVSHEQRVVKRCAYLTDSAAIFLNICAVLYSGGHLPAIFFISRPKRSVYGIYVARLDDAIVNKPRRFNYVEHAIGLAINAALEFRRKFGYQLGVVFCLLNGVLCAYKLCRRIYACACACGYKLRYSARKRLSVDLIAHLICSYRKASVRRKLNLGLHRSLFKPVCGVPYSLFYAAQLGGRRCCKFPFG